MVTKVVHTSGTRKRAVARATLKPGKGLIRINKMLLDVYGGGWQAQSEATRLAIARGLLEFSGSKDLKQTFLDYDRHLIVADIRTTEPSKPNDSKPRAK